MPEAVRRQNNKRPMKKSFSLAAIFMAMAFVANVQTAYADRQGFNPKEPACALPAENLLDAANDNFNFKSFEVVADAAQAYFVEFWLKGKLLRNEREDSSLQEMLLAGGINMDTSRPLYQ